MAKKKSTKKVYQKGPSRAEITRSHKSRMISFIVGVVTVVIVGFLIFVYSRTNNYTQVLGSQTSTQNNLK